MYSEIIIKNDVLYTCDRYGNIGKRICENTLYATFDDKQKLFLITSLNGLVETRDAHGNRIRKICDDAVEARFSDTDIRVRRKDGINELRDKYGNLIKRL